MGSFLKLGLLLYEEFYIHYTKLSFTYSRKHIFYFVCLAQGKPSFSPRLACGSPKLMGPGTLPWLTPLSVGLCTGAKNCNRYVADTGACAWQITLLEKKICTPISFLRHNIYNCIEKNMHPIIYHLRERPFNLKGGYGFFLKKYSDSQRCWKKYSDFGGGKKIIWLRIFVI